MLLIFCVQTGTIIDWDMAVNTFAAENPRKMVLKNIMDET